MKITKSLLRKIIKEEIDAEMSGGKGEQSGSRQIRVDWDTDGEGSPPPGTITLHEDSVRDWNQIKEEEGILRADQAIEDMLSDETGWLVLDWDWID